MGLFHFRLVPGFDPHSVEEYLFKFGLTLLHHVEPEEFKQRYKIRTKMGLDVIEVERLAPAAVIGECKKMPLGESSLLSQSVANE